MVATAFALGQQSVNHSYDLCINAGIAGAFDRSLEVGEVVEVCSDVLAEMGAEDGAQFLSLEEMGMSWPTAYESDGSLRSQHHLKHHLRQVDGITVNKVHGNVQSIASIQKRHPVQVESMEGAAFLHAMRSIQQNAIQIRAISNYVEKRDKSQWNIPLALNNLSHELYEILKLNED